MNSGSGKDVETSIGYNLYKDEPDEYSAMFLAGKIPFTGWLAIAFYAMAMVFLIAWADSSRSEGLMYAVASFSSLITGAVLGALSKIIRLLRDIRDQLAAPELYEDED